MRAIDIHCDTLMAAYFKNGKGADIYEFPEAMIDIKRMKKGDALAQFFAIFIPPQSGYKDWYGVEAVPDEEYIKACAEIFENSVSAHSEVIAKAENAGEIQENERQGKMSAVLTMEDGVAVQGKMENLERFYKLGVRALSLTWNFENCFGAPNSKDPEMMQKGLTPFGKEAVGYMQELGILVDVSHLSDGGFKDVAEICRKPFAATHSNCRALCPHTRNLTDEMIRTLGNAGGVSGLNFGPEFLNEDITSRESTAALLAKHARHMADTGGADCVAIGSDFDGIGGNIEISDCSRMELLERALQKEGFSGNEIEKIFNKNVLRVMKESMK